MQGKGISCFSCMCEELGQVVPRLEVAAEVGGVNGLCWRCSSWAQSVIAFWMLVNAGCTELAWPHVRACCSSTFCPMNKVFQPLEELGFSHLAHTGGETEAGACQGLAVLKPAKAGVEPRSSDP